MSRKIRLFENRLEERLTPAGALDPSFGVSGKVTTHFPYPSDDSANSVAIDSVGRIVVAGTANNGAHDLFAVTRYMPDGVLDTTFGGTGIVTVSFGPTSSDEAFAVAVDSTDRIIVAGSTQVGLGTNIAIIRLASNGSLDTSFDFDGKRTINFPGTREDVARDVALDSAGRIVIAGYNDSGSDSFFAIARLTPAGAVDPTFGYEGLQTIKFTSSVGEFERAYGVAVDTSDRIVVTGDSDNRFALARLTTTGQLDTSFDFDGKISLFISSFAQANDIVIDSTGRILVAGYASINSKYQMTVARFTSTGALDTTFDTDGKQTIAISTYASANSITVDASNRPLVAGYTLSASITTFAIARLTSIGALDATYGIGGTQSFAFGTSRDFGQGVVLDATGRAIIVGSTQAASSIDFAIARLTSNGVLDNAFDSDGKKTTTIMAASNAVGKSSDIDSQGRIVVAGSVRTATLDYSVTRYMPNGIVDTTFGSTGTVTLDFFSGPDTVFDVAVDSMDRIVVAGYEAKIGYGYKVAIVRWTADGVLDTTFDGDGILLYEIGQTLSIAGAMTIDSADRILFAGSVSNGSSDNFVVTRFTTSGAPDTTFDVDGKQTVDFGADDTVYAITVDSLDRIVVAGSTVDGDYYDPHDLAIARLTTNGALDSSFDFDGKRTIGFGTYFYPYEPGYAVTVDSTDRVVVALSSGSDFGIVRLTTSGALDSSFDGDGRKTIDFGSTDIPYDVALDSLGRILIAGIRSDFVTSSFAITRLSTTGALDTSFDSDGKQTISFGSAKNDAFGIEIDSLGRTIIAGYTQTKGNEFALARLRNDLPSVVGVELNEGEKAQRSRVTSLLVTFDQPVTLPANPADAFQLKRQSDNAAVSLSAQVIGTSVRLTFDGGSTEFGSLKDGRYTFTAYADLISGGKLDGDNNGIMGGNYVLVGTPANKLFRLFGDYDGNGTVNAVDFAAFRSVFGLSGPSPFDFNNDNQTNAADFTHFRARFGVEI